MMVTSVVGLLLRSCALCRLGAALDALALVQVHHVEVPGASPPAQQAGGLQPTLQVDDTPDHDLVKETKKGIWELKLHQYSSAASLARGCSNLNRIVLSNHMVVSSMINSGVPDVIGQGMLRFPDNRELQLACLQLAASIAAHSRFNARAEMVYVLEPALLAVESFGANDPWAMASLALLQDNCYGNKESFQRLHAIKRVTQLADQNYGPDVEAEAQCFFSSACGDGHQTAALAQEGYIPRALKAMVTFQGAKGMVVRRRVLTVLAGCFLDQKAYLGNMVEGGIIGLLFDLLQSATSGSSLDDVERSNLYISSMEVMEALARANSVWRSKLVREGAIPMASRLLSTESLVLVASEPKADGGSGDGDSAPTETGCPTALHIGRPPILLSTTCRAVAALMDSGRNQQAVAEVRRVQLPGQIERRLQEGKTTIFDPDALRACALFRKLAYRP